MDNNNENETTEPGYTIDDFTKPENVLRYQEATRYMVVIINDEVKDFMLEECSVDIERISEYDIYHQLRHEKAYQLYVLCAKFTKCDDDNAREVIGQDIVDILENGDVYRQCPDCEKYVNNIQNGLYEVENNDPVCRDCRNDHYCRCERCDGYFHENSNEWEDGDNSYCGSCWQEVEDENQFCDCGDFENCSECEDRREEEIERAYVVPFRKHKIATITSDTEGDIIKSMRRFSCEIEHYYTDKIKAVNAYNEIPGAFGISTDGSLNNSGSKVDGLQLRQGIEIQTCILQGEAGEHAVRTMLRDLTQADCKVDRTCGLHVHIDTMDIQQKANAVEILKRILAFYMIYEPVIQSFIPKGRRGNRYAQLLNSRWSLDRLRTVKTLHDLQAYWYETSDIDEIASSIRGHYHRSRYYGVNLHCLFQGYNNIEIRSHSGTLSAKKVLEWANLHCRIVDYCVDNRVDVEQTKSLNVLTSNFYKKLVLTAGSKKYFMERIKKFKVEDESEDTYNVKEADIPESKRDYIIKDDSEPVETREEHARHLNGAIRRMDASMLRAYGTIAGPLSSNQ